MISKKMEEILNKQMNAEFYNSSLYLAMAAWFEGQNLPGLAHWMEVQAGEERGHAMRFYNHIKERRGVILVSGVDAVPVNYKSPLHAFEAAYAHEVKVSAAIDKIVEAAGAEKDFATAVMLQWFVSEQVEEEASTDAAVQQLKMAGESKGGLMQIDHHLGKRKAG
ncbi:MAG: ferritin [Elusimicrobia bacterium RIFOXYB2_FULL_62_6]|nr:MAG: ferritin [Elusimicrobia bacterium RIFOXYB2_FULL_62_6]